jgi:DNA-binding response OmpR family regulator
VGRTLSAPDILLVEDDKRLASLTAAYLEQNGYGVVVEPRGDLAVARYEALLPRLVLLDVMLPGRDGVAVCRDLRRLGQVPILMLTALDTDLEQVVGLEAGADDYVVKPVDPIVLLARVRALLRRSSGARDDGPPELRIGGLRISERSREVWLDDRAVELTTQEFELLLLLAQRAGRPVSRDEVFRSVRGIDYDGVDRSIDVRISKLRRKLGDSGEHPVRIKTVWGKGYLLVPDAWGGAE